MADWWVLLGTGVAGPYGEQEDLLLAETCREIERRYGIRAEAEDAAREILASLPGDSFFRA